MWYFCCGINRGTFQWFVFLNVDEGTEREGNRKNPKENWDSNCRFCMRQETQSWVEEWKLRANSDIYQRHMFPRPPHPSPACWAFSLLGHLAVDFNIKRCHGRRRGKPTSWLLLLHCHPWASTLTALPMSSPSSCHSLTRQPLGSTLAPWQKRDVMFLSRVSSSCLFAVVSKADRNILPYFPSLEDLKTLTPLPFMGEVTVEF